MGKKCEWSNDELVEVIEYLKLGVLPKRVGSNAARELRQFTTEWKGARVQDGFILVPRDGVFVPVVPIERVNALLHERWRDPASGGYVGAEKFYKTISRLFAGITRARVEAFVASLETAQVHRPAVKHRVVRSIAANGPLSCIQMDTTEYNSSSGSWWIITAMDLFSKYAWVDAAKSPATAARVLGLLKSLPEPRRLQTDNGAEFNNEIVSEYLTTRGINKVNSLPYKSTSQGAIEKFNQTLKQKLQKWEYENRKGITKEIIQQIVSGYNASHHSTIGAVPEDVFAGEKPQNRAVKRPPPDNMPRLKPGDSVRVVLSAISNDVRRDKFRKGYLQQWSNEVYNVYTVGRPRIDSLTQPTFRLTLNGVPVKQRFYRAQLLRVENVVERAPAPARTKSEQEAAPAPVRADTQAVVRPQRKRAAPTRLDL